jgi:hypothetical protein
VLANGPVGIVAAAFLGSRLLVALAAFAAESLVARNPLLVGGAGGPLVTSLTSWDGWWYLGIAANGYHVAPLSGSYHDYAFFPLFPLAARLLAVPWPQYVGLVAVLIANVSFVLALVLLYRLTARVLDDERALHATVFLCIFPFSWALSMAYAESLFLLLMLGSFLAAERGHAGWAALLAALAALTRPPGVLLVIPLALVLWRTAANRRALAWLVLVPAAALLFWIFTWGLTGDPLAYLTAQSAWGRTGTSATGQSTGSLAQNLDLLRVSFLVTLLFYVFLFVFFRTDGISLAYVLVPLLMVVVTFLSGNISSIGRIGMVAFPFLWVLAGRRGAVFRTTWPPVSAGLLALTAVTAFAGWYQP